METNKRNQQTNEKRYRKWTDDEVELYTIILAHEENTFAASLEKLALKKSVKNEVFAHIKNLLDSALRDKHFVKLNEHQNFLSHEKRKAAKLRPRLFKDHVFHSGFEKIFFFRDSLLLVKQNKPSRYALTLNSRHSSNSQVLKST